MMSFFPCPLSSAFAPTPFSLLAHFADPASSWLPFDVATPPICALPLSPKRTLACVPSWWLRLRFHTHDTCLCNLRPCPSPQFQVCFTLHTAHLNSVSPKPFSFPPTGSFSGSGPQPGGRLDGLACSWRQRRATCSFCLRNPLRPLLPSSSLPLPQCGPS